MRRTFQYAFILDFCNREAIKEILINKRLTIPYKGIRLYASISEYAKAYSRDNKDFFRSWGIGIELDKLRNVDGLRWIANPLNWMKQGEYYFCNLPGGITIDFTSCPRYTFFAIAPTHTDLSLLVYKDAKEKFPCWYWKGIVCDWLYTPRIEELFQTQPLVDSDSDDSPIIQRVARAKNESEIAKYLSTKAVKGSHFSWKNEIIYSELEGTLF